MNISARRPFIRRQSGFSLVEMIGVLAIIAILAVVIVPKVFSTIASSRITSAVGSITAVKTAVAEFAGKYGTVPYTTGTSRIDELLVAQDFLEQRLTLKIGTQRTATTASGATWGTSPPWATNGGAVQTGQSRVTCQNVVPGNAPGTGANPTNFRLDGVTNLPTGSRVIAVAIPGLTAIEARELSLRIDGDAMTPTTTGVADDRGKVAFVVPAGAATYTAHIYIAHQ
jgi:prepilin-type N-terminal cleavage/methylation domain-containing protein